MREMGGNEISENTARIPQMESLYSSWIWELRERERVRERERGRVSVGLQKERVELLTAATHKTECLFTNTKRCTWLLSSVLSGLLTFVNYIYISFTPSSNFFLFTFLSVWTNLSFSTFALIIIIIILTSKYRFRELILFISEFN